MLAISEAATNGVGLAHVGELMGHVDTCMISRHYAHLAGNVQHMREVARKAAGQGGAYLSRGRDAPCPSALMTGGRQLLSWVWQRSDDAIRLQGEPPRTCAP